MCDVKQNHELAKELVAFANLRGGVVLLGVEDDGSIHSHPIGLSVRAQKKLVGMVL